MHLPWRSTRSGADALAPSWAPLARLYALLLTVMASAVLFLGGVGSSHAREGYLSNIYTMSPHGYSAADPMAGMVRAPMYKKVQRVSQPTANCRAAFVHGAEDPEQARIECTHDHRPTAALRDVRTMTSPIPMPRVVLSRWVEVAGPVVPVKIAERRGADWVAMEEFGVPEILPSQSGPVRAGFYSLF